jgi:hypothetical protein
MSESDLICCICLDELNIKEYKNISTTFCNHSFHTSCLMKVKKNKCPLCCSLVYEEEQINEYPEISRNQHRPAQIDEYSEISIFEFYNLSRNQPRPVTSKNFLIATLIAIIVSSVGTALVYLLNLIY